MRDAQGRSGREVGVLVAVTPEVRRSVEAAFRSYESRLFHAALRVTRDESDAWDAVQEGMVSALRHAERFRGDAAVASWMYSIVVNAALYQRRRAAARKRGDERLGEHAGAGDEQGLEVGTAFRDPEAYAMARVELDRVSACLERLPPDKLSLLERSIGGESCSEIAEAVGEPASAIKSRLWRTRCALREEAGLDVAA